MVNRRRRRSALKVTGDGRGVANHAGARLVADLADAVGLTAALSVAMAPTKQRRRGHDRGEVLTDLIVAIADGAETISDLATLRDQPDLFGSVASHPTVWRTLAAVDETVLERIKSARAQARTNAWSAGADPGFYVIDIDATLVGAHSDKEQAAPTWKRGFGFHPLLAYLDATGEALAGVLRPGNAGSGTAADHIWVLGDALAQLPIDPAVTEVIVRADSAGWSHDFADECRDRHVRFVIGHQLTVEIASVLVTLPTRVWQPATTADGSDWRDHAEVTEITHLVSDVFNTTRAWPSGLRMIARREQPHPARSSPSPTSTDTATKCSSPTWPTPTLPTSKRSTADADAPNDKSATPKPPVSRTCHRTRSPSTTPGYNSCSALTTCSLGLDCSHSPAPASPTPNPNGSATACSTPPPESPAPADKPPAASPPTGPGPRTSSPRSTAFTASANSAEHQRRGPPATAPLTEPANQHHPLTLTPHAPPPDPTAHDHSITQPRSHHPNPGPYRTTWANGLLERGVEDVPVV
jgi:Transposase DDE domain group 1